MWVVNDESKKQNDLLKKSMKKHSKETRSMIQDTFNHYFGKDTNYNDGYDKNYDRNYDRNYNRKYDEESGDSIREPNDE
jgi:hypothetical protein